MTKLSQQFDGRTMQAMDKHEALYPENILAAVEAMEKQGLHREAQTVIWMAWWYDIVWERAERMSEMLRDR